MKAGTVGWLKKVLEKISDDDMQVFIQISGVKFHLCGKVDKAFIKFAYRNEPEVDLMQESVVIFPCECSNEKEDQDKADITIQN